MVRGRAFEAAVFRHLREVAREKEARLGYFRQREELEIDFVLEDPEGLVTGIEVTSSPRPRTDKIARLRRAGKALGTSRLTLIHGGSIEEEEQGIQILPLQRFLSAPAECLR
jgi:predicted AAA+ superfamily ATPase